MATLSQADWDIGELYSTLEKEKLLDNTLIILSSDNGPVLNDGYYDDAVEKMAIINQLEVCGVENTVFLMLVPGFHLWCIGKTRSLLKCPML